MKIVKSDREVSPAIGVARSKIPHIPTISLVEGKNVPQIEFRAVVAEAEGAFSEQQVVLSSAELLRLIEAMANLGAGEVRSALGRTLSTHVRELVRLTAIASGTMPRD